MAYTTINKSTDYFNTKLYTGNGSTNAITGVGFQPDLTYIKCRTDSYNPTMFDAVRGATKRLYTHSNAEEGTVANSLTSFNSDGFTLGADGNVNYAPETFVSWNWKANGAGSANTDGSINSTATSANTTAGFSIVKYTGNGSNPSTVGHGLGAVPKFIITKRLSGDTASIHCYHAGIGNAHDIYLNGANAKASNTTWNNTTPTSSVFTVNNIDVNVSGAPYIAYCFAEKAGYSKFGSYTGNGNADGSFIYLGFKPAFFMIKRTDGSGDKWRLWDNARSPFNLVDDSLAPNESSVEYDDTSVSLDFLSNGVKMKMSGGGAGNGSGETYIYMAFGQSLVGSNNVPCTAF